MRATKIVCTIGPACRDPAILEQLIDGGMNVARLNMSHGDHSGHRQNIAAIRGISARKNIPVAILMDLCGPKLRLGALDAPFALAVGDELSLTTGNIIGKDGIVPVDYDGLVEDLSVGDQCSLGDGAITLVVTGKEDAMLRVRALSAGQVRSRMGIHFPTGGNHAPILTEKDVEDLKFGIAEKVDWIALSFVRTADDAKRAREIIAAAGAEIPLIAKIERLQAVAAIDAILEAFDGIMVARGDLGVEAPLEDVPGIQKQLIRKANMAAKPVITATQMLLSMMTSPLPTRAEAADVANAILDGTDAVMLSEETARGEHPVAAAGTMARIARAAERIRKPEAPPYWDLPLATNNAIARASRKVAELIGAKLIITPTASGGTVRLAAMCNPTAPILALVNNPAVANRLCLTRGVIPRVVAEEFASADRLFEICRREARESGLAAPGDRVVVTAGYPINQPGTTNLLQVMEI